jgi:hypothetical protein
MLPQRLLFGTRQGLHGIFDLSERAHAREDAETPALRKHSAAATPSAKSACPPSPAAMRATPSPSSARFDEAAKTGRSVQVK